jgi:hypothetical protein
MIKKILFGAVLIVGVACAVILARTDSIFKPSTETKPVASKPLPGGYARIAVGMAQKDVVSLVGSPKKRRPYPYFQHKTPAEWAALQERVDNESAGGPVYDSTPSIADLRDSTELTHRFHDVWTYQPTPATLMLLYFSEDGILLNINFRAAPQKGSAGRPLA